MTSKSKTAPKRAGKIIPPRGGGTAKPPYESPFRAIVFHGYGIASSLSVRKSQAGYVAEIDDSERGRLIQVVLLAEGRVAGWDGARWLPDSGWTDRELEDLGFLCVGQGLTRRWLAPESKP